MAESRPDRLTLLLSARSLKLPPFSSWTLYSIAFSWFGAGSGWESDGDGCLQFDSPELLRPQPRGTPTRTPKKLRTRGSNYSKKSYKPPTQHLKQSSLSPDPPMNVSIGKNPTGIGPGPRAPTPTTSSARNTRQSSLTQPLTKEDIVSMDYTVKDAQSGSAYLSKTLLCLAGEPFTLEHLTNTLLHITQIKNISRPAIEAIRAVAFLLEQEVTIKTAEAVAAQVSKEISQGVVKHVITAIAPHMANLLTTNETLTANVETFGQVKTAADLVNTGASAVKDAVDQLTPSLTATQDSINSLLTATADLASNAQAIQAPTKSYSDALRTQTTPGSPSTLSAPASAALTRAAIRERQILIDPQRGHTLHTADQTTSAKQRNSKRF